MLDRKYIKMGEQVDRPTASTMPAHIEEGCILCEVVEAGVAKVTVIASPSGSEKIAGVAILPFSLPAQTVSIEQFTVPETGSLIFNLRNQSLVSGSELAAVVGASALTVDESSFSATPSTGTVKVDIAGGRIKFAAGDAGSVVNFAYRFNLTVVQARMRYQERSINNRDLVGSLMQVGVAKGYIEMGTDQFDSSADYSTGPTLKLGPNGTIATSGSGPAIPGGRVLASPDLSGSAQGPFLRFSALIA